MDYAPNQYTHLKPDVTLNTALENGRATTIDSYSVNVAEIAARATRHRPNIEIHYTCGAKGAAGILNFIFSHAAELWVRV